MALKKEVDDLKSKYEDLSSKITRLSITNFYDGPIGGQVEIENKIFTYNTELWEEGWQLDENKNPYQHPECDTLRYYLIKDDAGSILGYISESCVSKFRDYEERVNSNGEIYCVFKGCGDGSLKSLVNK